MAPLAAVKQRPGVEAPILMSSLGGPS